MMKLLNVVNRHSKLRWGALLVRALRATIKRRRWVHQGCLLAVLQEFVNCSGLMNLKCIVNLSWQSQEQCLHKLQFFLSLHTLHDPWRLLHAFELKLFSAGR